MRAALLPLLLAACRPAYDPQRIQRALSKTPIDVAALDEAFRAAPKALEIHAPAFPAAALDVPGEPWVLENVSSRPVWVRPSSLIVESRILPFLPAEGPVGYGYRLGGSPAAPPRPGFNPAEWVLLYPGERTPLAFDSTPREAGELSFRATVRDEGGYLAHASRRFNGVPSAFHGAPLASRSAAMLLLPPLDWPGAPWHGENEIDPTPLTEGRFELITEETPERYFGALHLEAFIVDTSGIFVGQGDMKVLSIVDDDAPSRRAIYGLPVALPSGDYRLLVRAPHAAAYFLDGARHACDLPDGAASRWIPFRLK